MEIESVSTNEEEWFKMNEKKYIFPDEYFVTNEVKKI